MNGKKDFMNNLLDILQKQRGTFIRTVDGYKIITNPLLYNSYEEEMFDIQKKIGLENKKSIVKELDGKPFPNECGVKIRQLGRKG